MCKYRSVAISTIVLSFLISAGCDKSGGGIIIDSFPQPIWEITAVQITDLQNDPPQLSITVQGNITSGGWVNPQLIQFQYIVPPQDGIYDFEFMAVPPKEASTTVITAIEVEYILDPVPEDLLGVRINAEQNSVVEMLNNSL